MYDVNAFERQVADEALRMAGPSEPVDDAAIFIAITATQSPKWRFQSMFSAARFVLAGAIVALFGGFLLAGLLTQPSDDQLPAVGASASATVQAEPTDATTGEPEPTGEAVVDTTIPVVLPGVDLVTEEVEPGVYRVDNDGVRDLAKANDIDIVAGHDGGIWLLRNRRFFRLGGGGWLSWPTGTRLAESPRLASEFEVAPDGTVWAAGASFDGQSWTNHSEEDDWSFLEVTPDGTLWAVWADPEADGEDAAFSLAFGYLDEDGWQALGPLGDLDAVQVIPTNVLVAGADNIWARVWDFHGPSRLVRFVDGAWREELDGVGRPELVAIGPDGTFWGVFSDWDNDSVDLARFDGDEWSRWSLLDTGFGPGDEAPQFEVAPDGSVWFGVRAGPLGGPWQSCDGVSRFDGETWQRYLSGLCVRAIDVTVDAAVWLLAKDPHESLRHVYLITPEAVQ